MVTSDTSFNIYSLSDGEFIETVTIPGFFFNEPVGPIPMLDGGWLCSGGNNLVENSGPYIARIHPDGSFAWQLDFPQYHGIFPPSISDSGIVTYGGFYGFRAIDSETGTELWKRYSGRNYGCGVTPDGNFIVVGRNDEQGDVYIRLLDPFGTEIWSVPSNSFIKGLNDTIIYRDGSILMGYRYGISLFEPDGTIRWTVDLNDLGMGADTVEGWILNPTPDGGLVAMGYGDDYHKTIFCLGAPN